MIVNPQRRKQQAPCISMAMCGWLTGLRRLCFIQRNSMEVSTKNRIYSELTLLTLIAAVFLCIIKMLLWLFFFFFLFSMGKNTTYYFFHNKIWFKVISWACFSVCILGCQILETSNCTSTGAQGNGNNTIFINTTITSKSAYSGHHKRYKTIPCGRRKKSSLL